MQIKGPSDVGGTCPPPTYVYNWEGTNFCCCGENCCWDRCLSSEKDKYPDCLSGVPNTSWEYNSDKGFYEASKGMIL